MMDARREAAGLQQRLRELGTPARAIGAKQYMRSELEFTGTTVPDVRRIATAWLRQHPGLDRPDLKKFITALWKPAVFEGRLLGAVLLQHRSPLLTSADLPWLERLARDCRAWALLDTFVPYAIDDVLERSPSLRRTTLKRWADDPDFWMRRSALLVMHRSLAKEGGDWPLWVHLAKSQLEDQPRWTTKAPTAEERFFIRKALGWVLRDRSASQPDQVVAFVQANRHRMSGLTLREATRNLPVRHRLALGL